MGPWRGMGLVCWVVMGATVGGCARGGAAHGGARQAAEVGRARFVEDLLRAHPEKFGGVLARAEELRVQVLVAEVVTGADGKPAIVRHGFRADAEYFYPASAIKLCAAVAALEVLNDLRAKTGAELSENTPLAYLPLFDDDTLEESDPSNLEGGAITLAQEIRKVCLVSDNAAYNRVYEFAGHRELNEKMWAAGLNSVRINHRLEEVRSREDNRRTPRIEMRAARSLYTIPARTSDLIVDNSGVPGTDVGTGELVNGAVVRGPKSFLYKNRVSLRDLQDALVKVVRPDLDLGTPRFTITEGQRRLLVDAMTIQARESKNPVYSEKEFPDGSTKFFQAGLERVGGAGRWRITNKYGQAWGFTIDNAYIVDTVTGRGFFLAAAIYTNADGILSDDKYEYETVAVPFMADLGEVVGRELTRGRRGAADEEAGLGPVRPPKGRQR